MQDLYIYLHIVVGFVKVKKLYLVRLVELGKSIKIIFQNPKK